MSIFADFIPLSIYLRDWPESFFPKPEQFGSIGLANVSSQYDTGACVNFNGTLQLIEEIVFEVTPVPGIEIALQHEGELTEIDFSFVLEYDFFELNVSGLNACLRIETSLLNRMSNESGIWEEV